jgi:transcriptional regulator with XRE-family HTH domain
MISSDSPQDETAGQDRTPGARIRRARKARQWSLQQLALQMRLYARKRGDPAAAVSSLKPMISKWEHDKAQPDENNRRLLAAVLQVTVKDLGMTEDPDFIW